MVLLFILARGGGGGGGGDEVYASSNFQCNFRWIISS